MILLGLFLPRHTASFWNIIIQLTSHDDLTEKLVSLVSTAKLENWKKRLSYDRNSKLHHALWQKNCFFWIFSACHSGLRFQIILEVKSMDESSWKKNSIVSVFDRSTCSQRSKESLFVSSIHFPFCPCILFHLLKCNRISSYYSLGQV